ncbi:MAG: hypothetical protein CMC21_00485 [Flavobacteriaceae bacterium]|nr:hypothetical protein [Flavobacteriaceae bacterium]|tara:strand:+ start:534 stop:2462 length:1929 start_codon:yes stop_codon:yes gene_type:complete
MKKLFCLITFISFICCTSDSPQEVVPPTLNYTLTIKSEEGGSVSSTGGSYESGKVVTITATANPEYVFSGWSNGSTDNPLSVTMNSNQTITASFDKVTYTLSTSTEGEGSITETLVSSGRSTDYNSGSVVRLTAVPSNGWIFIGWTGDYVGEDNPIDIDVSESISISASFEISNLEVRETQLSIDCHTLDNMSVQSSFNYGSVAAILHYNSGGEDYMFIPGTGSFNDVNNSPNSSSDVQPGRGYTLKLGAQGWEFYQYNNEIKSWNIRNHDKSEDFIVIGDGNEIGPQSNWKGKMWYGQITSGPINWNELDTDNDLGNYHGVSIGDINNDNRLDFFGSPLTFFINEGGNQYRRATHTRLNSEVYNLHPDNFNDPTPNSPFYCGDALEYQIEDLNGDGIDEIIFSSNGKVEDFRDDLFKQTCGNKLDIFKFNSENGKYDIAWRSDSVGDDLVENTTKIRVFDVNNDGILDILRNWESLSGNAIETWIGKGNLEYELHSTYRGGTDYNMEYREFELMDVNNDGLIDIVLTTNGVLGFGEMTDDSNGIIYSDRVYIDPNDISKGIKLNNMILINDGGGTFQPYNTKELIAINAHPEVFHPFMKDGSLHFYGSFMSFDYWHLRNEMSDENTNTIFPIIYDIKVNLD